MPKKDINQIAFGILQEAIGESPLAKKTAKQVSGRKGGLVGGKKRMEALTPEQRSQLGKEARESRRIKEALTSQEVSANAKHQLNKVN